MEQMTDAMMPFFTLAIVLFGIETVFDMFWREHKKAKRERDRAKKREKRRLEYQDRRMANDAEHAKVTRAMRYDVLRRDGFHACGAVEDVRMESSCTSTMWFPSRVAVSRLWTTSRPFARTATAARETSTSNRRIGLCIKR